MSEAAKNWLKYEAYLKDCARTGTQPGLASQRPPRPSDGELERERKRQQVRGRRAEQVRETARAKGIHDVVAIEQLAKIVPEYVDVTLWLDHCIREAAHLVPTPKPDLVELTPQQREQAERESSARQRQRINSVDYQSYAQGLLDNGQAVPPNRPIAEPSKPVDADELRAKLGLNKPLNEKQRKYTDYCRRVGDVPEKKMLDFLGAK